MIKTKFNYRSEDEDENEDFYDEDEYYDEEDYYDEDDYVENINDEDYIPPTSKKINLSRKEKVTNIPKVTTIYNKKLSNFEKRFLKLFKFQTMKIIQFLDQKSIANLTLSCKMIKETLGQLIWNLMCWQKYNIYLDDIKDLPQEFSYYLFFFLKTKKPMYILLEELIYFPKLSKKLTESRKWNSLSIATIFEKFQPNLLEKYDIGFVTKKYLFCKSLDSEDHFILIEMSYDLKVKQILKIILPSNQSFVNSLNLPNEVIQFRTKDNNDQEKTFLYFVHFSKFFQQFKKNTATITELSFSKVYIMLDEKNAHYYTDIKEIKGKFNIELSKDNELWVKYKEFNIEFKQLIYCEGQELLCLIDLKIPLLIFVDYMKPRIVKILPLDELQRVVQATYQKEGILILKDRDGKMLKLSMVASGGKYSFIKRIDVQDCQT